MPVCLERLDDHSFFKALLALVAIQLFGGTWPCLAL